MNHFRIGEKMISPRKIEETVFKVLNLRSQGLSQQEVADRLSLDRSFISRLESIGEVRRGGRIALIGFPLSNREALREVAEKWGIDYILLMSDEERWRFLENKSGIDLFNQVMGIISSLRDYNTLVIIGSSKWKNLAEALLDAEIVFLELGETPIEGDREVDPGQLEDILRQLVKEGGDDK